MFGSEDWVGEEARCVAADHVDMGGHHMLRVEKSHDASNHTAPVSTLRHYAHRNLRNPFSAARRRHTIFIIPKFEHEFMTSLSVLR